MTALKIQTTTPVWDNICSGLKRQLGNATYNSWIKPLSIISYDKKVLTLSAPTRFIREWVESHFASKIKFLSQGEVSQINIIVNNVTKLEIPTAPVEEVKPEASLVRIKSYAEGFGSKIDPRFSFESFIVARSNELAFAAAKRIADNGYESTLNPLFLHSGVGLGKTHLMHAIANRNIENQTGRRVVYLSAEKFMHQYVRSLKERNTIEFKESLRAADILMIDDFQFIADKESTREEFFHTVTSLVESGKQLVISCDRMPADFADLPDRMRSRLSSGLVADIEPADYELRLNILYAKAEVSGIQVEEDILEFLAANITTNIREVEGALNRIIARATLVNKEITMVNVRDWVADLLKIKDKPITVEEIQDKVAAKFGLKTSELLSATRAKNIALPRQVAMYLAKQLTTKSLIEIGKLFGGKDHTTVLHACRKIDELKGTDSDLSAQIEALTAQLKHC